MNKRRVKKFTRTASRTQFVEKRYVYLQTWVAIIGVPHYFLRAPAVSPYRPSFPVVGLLGKSRDTIKLSNNTILILCHTRMFRRMTRELFWLDKIDWRFYSPPPHGLLSIQVVGKLRPAII